MKKVFKIILLVWPIVLLLGMLGHYSWMRHSIDGKMMEADGLVWKAGEKRFTAQVDQSGEGEKLDILIKIVGPEDQEIYELKQTIDRDMFGGGFVRAVQCDEDPEQEILVWQPGNSYYLDFQKGSVEKMPLAKAQPRVRTLAEKWHKYNVMAALETTMLLLFVVSYYSLYLIIKISLRLFRRWKSVYH